MKNIVKSRIVFRIALAMTMLMLTVQVSSVSVAAQSALSISITGPTRAFLLLAPTSTYTITVMNRGSSAYNGVIVTETAPVGETIPVGMSYFNLMPVVTPAIKIFTWNLGILQPGSTTQITLTLVNAVLGSWTNTVSVTTSEGASAQASITTTII